MKTTMTLLLLMLWTISTSAATYEYPFDDTYVATVVGTPEKLKADLPEKIPVKQRRVTIFPEREIPEVFWFEDAFRYSYAAQKKPAPLIFLIAGTGGSHAGDSTQMLARAFYQAGFHVVALSSPSFMNFIITASRSSVPGHAVEDAKDLYRVMEKIWADLQGRLEVTDFYIAGYSLGGFNTAFVTWLDEQRQVFRFKKALLINPPLRLYNSISLLDRMVENIPGGLDNFNRFFQQLVQGLTQVYKNATGVDLSEDTLYKAYQALQLKDEELAALIGVSFRIASSNMAFASDVMTDFGFIKPKNLHLTANTSLAKYNSVGVRLGFTDYFHEYFYPYWRQQDPDVTIEGMVRQMSLGAIEDYLKNNEKIEVMHNENDLILAQGEIDFFRRVFGDRAKIYPVGGHLGNMAYKDNVAHMIGVFKQ